MTAKNAAILGASFDTVQENKAFADKFNFPYPLLSATKEMGEKYGAADGSSQYAKRIAYVIGPDGKVKHVFPKAATSSFANDVLALL